MRTRFLIALLLFVSSGIFQVTHIGLDAFTSDEGLVQVAAVDVAQGRVLYRDSYVPVTPLVYLLQGAVFKVFGVSFGASRLLALATNALNVSVCFLIANALMRTQTAVICALMVLLLPIWTWPHGQFFSYSPLAVTLCMLALHFASVLERSEGRRSTALWLGAVLGLAVWTKPNLGLAAGFGIFLFWLSAWVRSFAGLPVTRARSFLCILREGIWTTTGVLVVSVPFVTILVATDTFGMMVDSLRRLGDIYAGVPQDVFPNLFPLASQTDALRVNPSLTIPGMLSASMIFDKGFQYLLRYTTWIDQFVRILYYTSPALLLGASAYLSWRSCRGRWTPPDEAALLVLLVAVALHLTLLPHAPIQYLTPLMAPVIVLAFFLASRSWDSLPKWRKWLVRGVWTLGAGGFLSASAAIWALYVTAVREPVFSNVGTIWLPPNIAGPLSETLSFARATVKPGEKVFAVPCFPIFYFLSGIEHATRFIDLRPGSPGMEAEDEMIADLERERLEYVYFFVGVQFPGNDPFQDAYPRFYRYLVTHYVIEKQIFSFFGPYVEIYRREQAS